MRNEARARWDDAVHRLAEKEGYDFSCIWNGGDAEVWYMRATCAADRHDAEACAQALETAVDCGFCEPRRVETDPAFETVRQDTRIGALVDRLSRHREGHLARLRDKSH